MCLGSGSFHSRSPDLDPPILQNDPLRLLPFHFDADPDPAFHFDADSDKDPAFHFDADPDPASQNDADPDLGMDSGILNFIFLLGLPVL
jgi:hypothetical protein